MRRIRRYLPALLLTIAIPMLSLINPDYLPETRSLNFSGLDKIVHLLMYALLTFAWALTLTTSCIRPAKLLLIAIAASFYGLIMEIMQYCFTKNRSMDFWDSVANLGGALIAAALIYIVYKGRCKTSDNETAP